MGTYSSSEATRMAFISAAGELFAEYGVSAVSIRDIARKCGENIGSIHYHFGGKSGLLDAVLDYATERWQRDPIGRYLKEQGSLLDSGIDGQRLFVRGLIDILILTIFAEERPCWCGMLVFQVLQRDIPVSKRIQGSCAAPVLDALRAVHARITGDANPERAFCWIAVTLSPMQMFSIDPVMAKQVHLRGALSLSILASLREMTMKSSLVNLGLWEPSLEKSLL